MYTIKLVYNFARALRFLYNALEIYYYSFRKLIGGAVVAGVLVLSGVGGFLGWFFTRDTDEDEPSGATFKKQAVATDNKQCSTIGSETLSKNGSAVDAAIASMFCLGVINMHSSGIAGGGVMLVYDRSMKQAKVFDFRETAPATANKTMFTPDEDGLKKSRFGLYRPFFYKNV